MLYDNYSLTSPVGRRIDENDEAGLGDGLGGVDGDNQNDLNEGQKIVFQLQDLGKNV